MPMKNHKSSSAFSHVILVIFIFQIAVFNLLSCKKKPTAQELEAQKRLAEEERAKAIELAKDSAISEYASSMSDEARISQLFLVNIEGNQKYSSVEKTGSLYGKPREGSPLLPGGVLLFSYNISKDPLETYNFIKSIHDFYVDNQNLPPYVAVDQEGGDVNRLRGLTSVLWAQKKVAESFSLEGSKQLYSAQARQMRNLGFHMNLAPVAEVLTEKNRGFLDSRSFGNLEAVLSYGDIAVKSYEENGIAVVLKHFPGNSNADPHLGLPKIEYNDGEWETYFKPFQSLLPKASAMLMSHAIMQPEGKSSGSKELSEELNLPACFSSYWIRQVAKKEFCFTGLVFSDDIFMGALAKNGYPPEKAALEAIKAGVDVIMLSEKRFGQVAGLLLARAKEDSEFAKEINRAVENVIRYKIKAGILDLKENEVTESSEIPSFTLGLKTDYAEFDLKKFDEDYKDGMKAFEMAK